LGRLALRSTVHRMGAAAPDAPGDGERGVSVLSSRRGRSGTEDPPSSRSVPPPVSAVESVSVPESGGVEASPPPAPTATAPAPARPVESTALRSSTPSIDEIRASAPDLEAPAAEADPFAGMTPAEICWLAKECLAERDLKGTVEACEAGCRAAPDDPDLISL